MNLSGFEAHILSIYPLVHGGLVCRRSIPFASQITLKRIRRVDETARRTGQIRAGIINLAISRALERGGLINAHANLFFYNVLRIFHQFKARPFLAVMTVRQYEPFRFRMGRL